MTPAAILSVVLAATAAPAGPDLEAMQAAYTNSASVGAAERLLTDAALAAEPFFATQTIPPDDAGRCALARLLVRQARALPSHLLEESRAVPVDAPTPLLSAFTFAFGQAGWCQAHRAALKAGYAKALAALAVQRLGPEKAALEQSATLLSLLATNGPAGQAALKASNSLHALAQAPETTKVLDEYLAALTPRLESMRAERAELRCVAGTAVVKLVDRELSPRTAAAADPDFAQELAMAQHAGRRKLEPLPEARAEAGALYEVKLAPCRATKLPALAGQPGPRVVLHTARALAHRQAFEVAGAPGAPVSLPDADRQLQTWASFTEKDVKRIDQDIAVTESALAGVREAQKRLSAGGQYAAAKAQVIAACRGW